MLTKLTIGMATYRDFDGVYFTINNLRLNHADVIDRCELVVVDNDPDGPQAKTLQSLVAKLKSGAQIDLPPEKRSPRFLPQPFHVQYVTTNVQGTSAPRDEIFRRASGDAVLVIDSHVLPFPGAIRRLLDYFDAHPDSRDLIQGPLLMDPMSSTATHFSDVWRRGMWGTWGSAWIAPDGRYVDVRQATAGTVELFELMSNAPIRLEAHIPWARHELALRRLGFTPAAETEDLFEIPAQGLGYFACRRDAWLGFHPEFREFGGEEWYIHHKFRQAGHRCLCDPQQKWMHRFADPGAGRNYQRSAIAKIRNYVLGHLELGLPLDRVRRHFVDGLNEDPTQPISSETISPQRWDRLVANPTQYPVEKEAAAPPAATDLESLYRKALHTKSDINEHCPKLRELASQCDTVVEFGMRHGVSTVALLAGQPKRLLSVDLRSDPIGKTLADHAGATEFEFRQGSSLEVDIPPCDLLFIDTKHTADHLSAELEKHAPQSRRWIAMHDTVVFGTRGEDGQRPGLLHALQQFMESHPEWAIVYHAINNHGFTVISRHPEDRPATEIKLWSPSHGPGTELKKILSSLGIDPAPTCDCNARAYEMDAWGVDGCRQRREEIIGWMKEGQSRWGWAAKFSAMGKAVATGLAFRLNPLDPFPSLVDEAIRRAEAAEQKRKNLAT